MTDFTKQLIDTMKEYSNTCETEVQKVIEDVSKEARKKLSSTSPKKTGKYKRGWRVKFTKRQGYYKVNIHNPSSYQLTHLLEKGHKVRGGYSPAIPHIKAVEEWANAEVEKRIKEVLSR